MAKNVHSHAEDLERIEENDFWSKVKVKLILDLVEGARVLDVGCGSGRLSKTLLDRGYSVVATDTDWKAVEIAKKKGIAAFLSDITYSKIDEKFDCIILGDVLEHIENDNSVMKKIHNMLKTNGCIVVNVPSYLFCLANTTSPWDIKEDILITSLRPSLKQQDSKSNISDTGICLLSPSQF